MSALVKTSILLALKVAAQNLSQLSSWSAKTADTRDPLTLLDISDHGFVEFDAHGAACADRSPPGQEAA